MRKRLLTAGASLATAAGHAVRTLPGVLGGVCAVVGAVDVTGEPGAGWLTAAAFLLILDQQAP